MNVVNNQFINAFLDSISEGIVVVNSQSEIVYTNDALMALLGYSIDELLHQKLEILIPNRIKHKHAKFVSDYYESPKKQRMSERDGIFGQHKNGDLVPIEVGLNHFESDGKRYALAIVSDVSHIKKTNRFLKTLHDQISTPNKIFEEKIASILALGCKMFDLPIGILAKIDGDNYSVVQICADEEIKEKILSEENYKVDHTYCRDVIEQEDVVYIPHASKSKKHKHPCSYVNQLETFIGAKVMVDHQLYGTINFSSPTVSQEVISNTDLEILKLMAQLVGDKLRQQNLLHELKAFNSKLELKVESRTEELKYALSEIQDINKSLEDEISKRKEAEDKVKISLEKEKKLNALKSRFVSTASHEFRTPLTGILSSVTLIQKYGDLGLSEKRDKHIEVVKKSVKNLTNILDDMLSINKIESGKIDCDPSLFDVLVLFNEVVDEMNPILKNGQKISFIPEHLSSSQVFQDRKFLKNILINLISNAIKYSHEHQHIEVLLKEENKSLKIDVVDKGIGIPKEEQTNLFERFFRASNVNNYQGTGLGLNITKRYVELMSGSLSFKSSEDEGSTFTVLIPKEFGAS